MIAALPMYDRPSTAAAHDRLWRGIRGELAGAGIDAPLLLSRDMTPMESWGHPDLLLGQICNLPYRRYFRDRLERLGATDLGRPDLAPGTYVSLLVARVGTRDIATAARRFALNDRDSHSGWGAAVDWARTQGMRLTPILVTGAHAASATAVQDGAADLGAIDINSFRILQAEGACEGLTIVGQTAPSPGMTFVTARRFTAHAPAIGAALTAAIDALDPADRDTIGLAGLHRFADSAYFDLEDPPDLPQTASHAP